MNGCVLSVSRYLIPAFVTACLTTGSLAQGGPPGPVAFSLDGNSKDPALHKYTVPSGLRLSIEYVSGACVATAIVSGKPSFYDDLQIAVITGGASNLHRFNLPINPIPFDPSLILGVDQTRITFAHLVKLYADPGTDVTFSVPTIQCNLAFSGQLVSPN